MIHAIEILSWLAVFQAIIVVPVLWSRRTNINGMAAAAILAIVMVGALYSLFFALLLNGVVVLPQAVAQAVFLSIVALQNVGLGYLIYRGLR